MVVCQQRVPLLRWLVLLLLALPLSGCVDLNAHEPVPDVAQPDWSRQPIYDAAFGSFTSGGDCDSLDVTFRQCVDFTVTTTGGGDVFVTSDSGMYKDGRVLVYNGTTLAHKRTIDDPALKTPRGIAYYRGELFVLDGTAKAIFVFDPGTGALKRRFEHPAAFAQSDFALDRVMLTGMDAAWGELWITFHGGIGGGGITVLDSQTGTPKGVWVHQPRTAAEAPTDSNEAVDSVKSADWWDIATVPEENGIFAQCRMVSRGDLVQPVPLDEIQPSEIGVDACASKGRQGGMDAVWGMRWFLTVQEPDARTSTPLEVHEYAIETDGSASRLSPLRRSWQPRLDDDPLAARDVHYDIAYQARDARINWDGKLTTQEWLRGTHCVNYVVSDADIYVVGGTGERWYEPARGFQKIQFHVDGVNRLPEKTTPTGQFCFDTNTMASGTHTVTLKAWVNNGTKTATVSNDSTNFDHNGPTGAVTSPGDVVTAPVSVTGAMVDPHSGSQNWSLEASLSGGAWQTVCTVSGESQGVNQWAPACTWDAGGAAYPEGVYQLRGRMNDMVTSANGGSNVSYTAPVTVRVDKTPPTATFSGELKDAEDLRPLYDDEAPAVSVVASDNPGSGIRRLEFYVDSIQRNFGEQTCPGGNCGMTRTFTLRPGDYGEGNHMVTVRVIDQAGHSRDYQWEVAVERLFAPDPEGTDIPPGVDDSASRSTLPSSDVTNGALFENAAADESPIPANELLPCDGENDPTGFPVYSVGPVFEGLSMTLSYRRCDVPWPEEVVRANFVSFMYGDCTVPEGVDNGGCAPPLEIQSWPTCERNLGSIEPMPSGETLQYSQIQVNGTPAASFDDGLQVEVFTGRTTVVVFGDSAAQVLRAAAAIQAQPQGNPLAFPATASSSDPLPDPIPGIVEGDVPCV